MRIAIAGKGGTGKTTISGTMARSLAQADRRVVAVDGDSNPNLSAILGENGRGDGRRGEPSEIQTLPSDLLQTVEEPDGTTRTVLARPPSWIVEEYGSTAPDGVELLIMGRIGHAGAG